MLWIIPVSYTHLDVNEYSAIFEHCNRRLEHLPGRCFAEVDKQILECQAYLPFAGEKEFERAEAIRGYIEKRNGECTEVARKIPLIPPVLSMKDVYKRQFFEFSENIETVRMCWKR